MKNMKYKVGDRVKIKSLDWHNRHTNGTEVDCGAYPFTSDMKEFCGQERIIANVCQECYFLSGIDDKYAFTDEMIEGLVEEMSLDKAGQITDFEYEGLAYTLPDGYQFIDENGNVINATKIVLEKKKKEYPKTYEECCKIMQVARPNIWFDYDDVSSISEEGDEYERHIENILCTFRKLLICRDAYWKFYGEEKQLGDSWKPDWDDGCYVIFTNGDGLIRKDIQFNINAILAFPTAELRDMFYERFKTEIEFCKELL